MYARAAHAESSSAGSRRSLGPAGGAARAPALLVAAGLLVAAAGLLAPGAASAQQGGDAEDTVAAPDAAPRADTVPGPGFGGCPEELAGPPGAAGVPWGDTLAAISRLATDLDVEPLPGAGADVLLRRGDRAFRAGHHTLAYAAYAAGARADGGYEALWKTARAGVDVGQDAGEDAARAWYRRAEEWARRAVEARPSAPEGHLQLAQALGLVALDAGGREKVRLSEEIREEALATIEADSSYAGGWHVLGRWNRGVRELSGPMRFFARTFLGGEVLGEASWEKAERYLERAAELEPGRIVHHLELARVLRAREKPAEARAAAEKVLSLPPRDYHDCVYRAEARDLLADLEGD